MFLVDCDDVGPICSPSLLKPRDENRVSRLTRSGFKLLSLYLTKSETREVAMLHPIHPIFQADKVRERTGTLPTPARRNLLGIPRDLFRTGFMRWGQPSLALHWYGVDVDRQLPHPLGPTKYVPNVLPGQKGRWCPMQIDTSPRGSHRFL